MRSQPVPASQNGARHQQHIDELCAAAIRALSGQRDIHYRGRRLYRGRTRLAMRAPHLHPRPGADDLGSFRGAADAAACRLLWSDPGLHERLCPSDPVARLVFDQLEQYRTESLISPEMSGLASNLAHRHREWSLAFHRSGLTETETGLLLYALSQVCRARLTGEPMLTETEGLIEDVRFALAPLIGADLAGLVRHRGNQETYALHALGIARTVSAMISERDADLVQDAHAGKARSGPQVFTLWEDSDEDLPAQAQEQAPTTGPGDTPSAAGAVTGYHVFTTAYDRVQAASAGIRPELLSAYRRELDELVAKQPLDPGRVAHELQVLCTGTVGAGWEGGHEEGYVDGRVLARLVSNPGERNIFRYERRERVPSMDVTLLVDCSGSMKQHLEVVAVLVDVLARALDLIGVDCEVLGFTTGAWAGGRALQDWLRAGRPAQPGRLNEVLHLVFEEAGTSWRTARRSLAAILHQDLFREGVDGEAVQWAATRAATRAAGRAAARGTAAGASGGSAGTILLVVSDGSPMDGATAAANGEHTIDDHLRDVVASLEEEGEVLVMGLGVGMDLSPYYRHSIVLDLSHGVRHSTFAEIAQVLGRAVSRGSGTHRRRSGCAR